MADLLEEITELKDDRRDAITEKEEALSEKLDVETKLQQALQKCSKLEKNVHKQNQKWKDERQNTTKVAQELRTLKKSSLFNQLSSIQEPQRDGNGTNVNTNSATNRNPTDAAKVNKFDVKWQQKYDLLLQFKQEFGHTNVSHYIPDHVKARYPKLPTWVSSQRTAFTWLKAGKKTTLTPHRIQLLKKIGFEWQQLDRDPIKFEDRLPQLRAFQEEFGHIQVPQQYTARDKLGNWVLEMRRKYREGVLSQDRIAALNRMGFKWSLRNRQSGGSKRNNNNNNNGGNGVAAPPNHHHPTTNNHVAAAVEAMPPLPIPHFM